MESALARLDTAALETRRRTVAAEMRRGPVRDALTAQAMGILREVTRRKIGVALYAGQLIGGAALFRGEVIEMDTGEGKTYTGLVAAALYAWCGRGVHVISANDYLAARDAEILRPALEALGVSVGVVTHETKPGERRGQYAADVTFVSNKEVAFDYLRDQLRRDDIAGDASVYYKVRRTLGGAFATEPPTLRGLDVAIVDEIDSVLADDAGTPLIISAETDGALDADTAAAAADVATHLLAGRDFVSDPHGISVELTPAGERAIDEAAVTLGDAFAQRIRRYELVTAALTATLKLHRDRQYLVRDGKIVLIDEQTGRTMPDRYWGRDLHLMVEWKEGLAPSKTRRSLASVSFQRFFRGYRSLAGMSGTVREISPELSRIYGLGVTFVPRRKPLRRAFIGRTIFANRDALWREAARQVAAFHAAGRPVLIGVRSVAEALRASAALAPLGVPHAVLSAAHDKEEAEIVARAGTRGAVTVATNMAGRGTDIKLGEGVAELGGLVVMLCERHDSQRVDRQLMGRCARQGEPGAVLELVSLEDQSLASVGEWRRRVAGSDTHGIAAAFARAQRDSERVRAKARLEMVRRDERLKKLLAFAGGMD